MTGPQRKPEAQGLYCPETEKDACGVGFIVDIQGRRSHQIVLDSLRVLENLDHRGACGCEENTGDGAGILLQIPHAFYARECEAAGFELPEPGQYGVGMVYLPKSVLQRNQCMEMVETTLRREGIELLGWRKVPVHDWNLGRTARDAAPSIRQFFIRRPPEIEDEDAWERRLYVVRKLMRRGVAQSEIRRRSMFYVVSLSARTIVYKGMLTPGQLASFYNYDLQNPSVTSALALVHSRFSTNTFPSWDLAQPFRMLCHNGEINTLRGNFNWMRARESLLASELIGEDIQRLAPVLTEGASDSAIFDQALELLVMGGRSLPHAMMMLIPEAWEGNPGMDPAKRDFYRFHSCLMEPWDGPASIAFTDGRYIGAVLDRNGLRPSRYYVTKDDKIVMASEVGVLDIPPDQVLYKGRLQPGRMFLVDTEEGRIIDDEELKASIAGAAPYGEWLAENMVSIDELPEGEPPAQPDRSTLRQRQQAFGYTVEDKSILIGPSAAAGKEPIGSMGTDTPLAVLSNRSRPLFDYFKQLFAQVTNPPLDAIREELVTSAETTIGPEGNLLDAGPESCRHISLKNPILDNVELARLRALGPDPDPYSETQGFHSAVLPMLFPRGSGGRGLADSLELMRSAAEASINAGCSVIILSDRGVDEHSVPIPSLLATAALHNHLVRKGLRTQAALVLESGEPREPHHFCLLVGYGASAVNPYLVFETLAEMVENDEIECEPGQELEALCEDYRQAMRKAIVKVMSKMGISTIQSYRGAQIFEAIGLGPLVIEEYFTDTPSRLGGVELDVIAREAELRHGLAFPEDAKSLDHLDWGGEYQWRRGGEFHLFNPETIAKLQHSTRAGDYRLFKRYTHAVDDQSRQRCTLRSMFRLKSGLRPVDIEEVEPVESIVRRFKTGAMSFGSISKEAHETLAIAMNRLGGRSNSGEGGEDPARFEPDENGDLRRSEIKQVASGRFGVTSHYLVNCNEIQIKMAQGAKPGEGGQLPGHKVSQDIARVRHSTPGVGLISPPPHHDIYSIEDLAQLIHDLKNANEHARINVKLVSEVGVGTVAAGVSKAHADVVLISGHDGGTGASPLTSLKHAGGPWELGVAETHQVLLLNNLRSRIVVEADGQMKTGRDVVVAALLGAEEFGFATAALVVEGCIMMRVCHLNTCPVGIATQDERLRKKYQGRPEWVENFFRFIAQEVREYMAQLGFRTIEEMVGRSDRLDVEPAIEHWKAAGLDLSPVLHRPDVPPEWGRYCREAQDHGLDDAMDRQLIERCAAALSKRDPVRLRVPIRNVNRTVGTMLGAEISRRWGADGLPDDTIRIEFAGSAGQSFGAFLPRGMTLLIEGDANDYIGKGLSGGKLAVKPPREADFTPEENIIIGNVALYGATNGEAYFRGLAGERFAVRNSGARAVVEGVGDHGCEYMTGGRVVVLGPTGRNFAAGMSGGIAYVLDEFNEFPGRCNLEMVVLEKIVTAEEGDAVRRMIQRHVDYTDSDVGKRVVAEWEQLRERFVKVMPLDYKRVLESTPPTAEKQAS